MIFISTLINVHFYLSESISHIAGKEETECFDHPEVMMLDCPVEYIQIYGSLIVCKLHEKPDCKLQFQTTLNTIISRNG